MRKAAWFGTDRGTILFEMFASCDHQDGTLGVRLTKA